MTLIRLVESYSPTASRLWTEEDTASLEAPPILQAIRNARDSAEAMEPFRPQNRIGAGAFLDPSLLIQDHEE